MSVTALVPILVLVPVVASIGRLVPRASHMAKETRTARRWTRPGTALQRPRCSRR